MFTVVLKKIYKYRCLLLAVIGIISVASIVVFNIAKTRGKNGPASVNMLSSEKVIFEFLTDEMELNTAAACGVLANIEKESGFASDVLEKGYTWEQGAGYGICQWTNSPRTSTVGRRTDLTAWCVKNGYDYTSLSGQLEFLQHELNTTTYREKLTDKLKSVPDSADGAYQAAYYWCYYFEVPSGYDDGVSEIRGDNARNKYWPRYSESEKI